MQNYNTSCSLCKKESPSTQFIVSNFQKPKNSKIHVLSTNFIGSVPDIYLDTPFEIEEIGPNNIRLSHPYINCSELNLATLVKSALYLKLASTATHEKKIASAMFEESIALLGHNSLSPRNLIAILQNLSKYPLVVHLLDTRSNHLLDFTEIFRLFRQNIIFLADIHDLGHHGVQQIILNDYVRFIGEEYLGTGDQNKRELIKFIHYMGLEYCIVGDSINNMKVFGCLNWQAPRKSPAELSNYHEICGECIVKWNAIRGLLSLKRRDSMLKEEHDISPLEIMKISINSQFNEEDIWKYYRSNPLKAMEMIEVINYPKDIMSMISLTSSVVNKYELIKDSIY